MGWRNSAGEGAHSSIQFAVCDVGMKLMLAYPKVGAVGDEKTLACRESQRNEQTFNGSIAGVPRPEHRPGHM